MTRRRSILTRLEKVESERCFVIWFLQQRFMDSLAEDELDKYVREGIWPDPAPNRSSPLDQLDRNALLKRWQEDLRYYEGRSSEDLQGFSKHGRWPEELGRLHYSNVNSGVQVEWRIDPNIKPDSQVDR